MTDGKQERNKLRRKITDLEGKLVTERARADGWRVRAQDAEADNHTLTIRLQGKAEQVDMLSGLISKAVKQEPQS